MTDIYLFDSYTLLIPLTNHIGFAVLAMIALTFYNQFNFILVIIALQLIMKIVYKTSQSVKKKRRKR